jgi:hypothetical protein
VALFARRRSAVLGLNALCLGLPFQETQAEWIKDPLVDIPFNFNFNQPLIDFKIKKA